MAALTNSFVDVSLGHALVLAPHANTSRHTLSLQVVSGEDQKEPVEWFVLDFESIVSKHHALRTLAHMESHA